MIGTYLTRIYFLLVAFFRSGKHTHKKKSLPPTCNKLFSFDIFPRWYNNSVLSFYFPLRVFSLHPHSHSLSLNLPDFNRVLYPFLRTPRRKKNEIIGKNNACGQKRRLQKKKNRWALNPRNSNLVSVVVQVDFFIVLDNYIWNSMRTCDWNIGGGRDKKKKGGTICSFTRRFSLLFDSPLLWLLRLDVLPIVDISCFCFKHTQHNLFLFF